MRIILDASTIKIMNLFESITHARVKDCIPSATRIIFVVEQGEMGKAIGKNGVTIRRIESALNRKIKIVEFNPDVKEFVRNLIAPLRVDNVVFENGKVLLESNDTATKSMIIGRNAQNLRANEEIAKRYFDMNEIRVV
jgi:transcription termination/antitermination protein NusA